MRADPRFVESLTVAMALAPGVYSRNRMFALFAQPGVQHAKFRAATLRGLVKQLKNAQGITVSTEGASEGGVHVLEFKLPELRLTRVAQLTTLELATLRILAARAGLPCLPPEPADRALVDATLARLLEGSDTTTAIAQAAAANASSSGE